MDKCLRTIVLARDWLQRKKDRIRYGKPQEDKFEISNQGRLPSITATVVLGNTSTKPRKVLKAGSISALKRCGNYNNSLSSVELT